MPFHKARALHEHTARTGGRVEDEAVEWFNNADDEPDNRGGCEELATLLPFAHSEVTKEIFVDLAEGVSFYVHGDGIHDFEQFHEQGTLEAVVGLGKYILEAGIRHFNSAHSFVDSSTYVSALRQRDESRKARFFRKIEYTLGLVVRRADGASSATFADQFFSCLELMI